MAAALEAAPESGVGGEAARRIELYSKLLAMTIVGLEETVGVEAAGGTINLAAKRLLSELAPPRSDARGFLEWVNRETVLRLRTYRVRGRLVREEERGRAFYLVAYECPIRQVLYLEDLPGGRSLCRLMCRFLGFGLGEALGSRVSVEPARIGPNSCLVRVGLSDGSEAVEGIDVEAPEMSMEEYVERLQRCLVSLLRVTGWALSTVLGANPAMSYRVGKNYGRMMGNYILAEGVEPSSLEEAVEEFNRYMEGTLRIRLEGDTVVVEEDNLTAAAREAGVSETGFIERIVQGFIAGVLESLLGLGVELRSTREPRVYRVMLRG